MNVKILCPCGTKFAFEVEPVNGRMPVGINCPACGANALALANAEIKRQLEAAAPPAPPPPAAPSAPSVNPLRIAGAPASPPQPAVRPVVKVATPARAPAPAASLISAAAAAPPSPSAPPEGQTLCAKHKTDPAVDHCVICKKPMCLKCMQMFGHVCSVYCRQQAELKRIYIPAYAGQKSVIQGKAHARSRLIAVGIAAGVVLFLGLWIWYAWFARNPRVVYTVLIPVNDTDDWKKQHATAEEYYDLIAPNQLLAIKNKFATLTDVTEQRAIWSSPLANFDSFSEPHVIATPNDVWIYYDNGVQRFDRQTGGAKTIDLKGQIRSVTPGEDSLAVVSGDDNNAQTLTQITLSDGSLQTEDITSGGATPATAGKGGRPSAQTAANAEAAEKALIAAKLALAQNNGGDSDDSATSELSEYNAPRFVPAGPNVVEFQTQLLEKNIVTHEAMKPRQTKSILDSGNVTASQGMDLAQEMMNDNQRDLTGGVVKEDVSRYQVTIHRRFAGGVPDWTGEVTGPPEFFALKKVDLVVAGNSLLVFDKQNHKLWDAKLANAAPAGYSFAGHSAPCLETSDSLYFADKGVLTRFDLATGAPRWRMNTVGVSEIQADQRGKLYVVSTTAGPDAINYSLQINVRNKVQPVIMKVDPDTGKVLWQEPSLGDHCILSGKFLYTSWVSLSQAWLKLEDGPDINYNLNLVKPSSGSVIWNYYQGDKRIIKTEIRDNWIMLHREDKVLVLKFFSL